MDCLNYGEQQFRDMIDEYTAALEPDIYGFTGSSIADSSPDCFTSPLEGFINPTILKHQMIQQSKVNSCDSNSAASSDDMRSNSCNSNEGLNQAAMNPSDVQVPGLNCFPRVQSGMAHRQMYYSSEDGSVSNYSTAAASMAAMREMIFRVAAMQPISIDPESIKRPKRRNVRISKDPQSIAARHRREKISERIRILQRLVPGGTKMDTASMLDEAIHYVKFLKRQVQALESAAAANSGPAFRQFNHLNSNPSLNFSTFSTNSSYSTSPIFTAADSSNSQSVCNNVLM
ncbi:hypothetical protein SUGI_1025940 [Cryptomeria japonica]|nr:hypothetical protein SUGI_1025940 [Cryptomeria japonica]